MPIMYIIFIIILYLLTLCICMSICKETKDSNEKINDNDGSIITLVFFFGLISSDTFRGHVILLLKDFIRLFISVRWQHGDKGEGVEAINFQIRFFFFCLSVPYKFILTG